MKLKEIIDFIDEKIPPSLALDFDDVGFKGDYDLNQEIDSIKIYMDLLPEDDLDYENTLIITHHPPLFTPKTPTYTIHSHWDIIDGKANSKFIELKKQILDNFENVRIVNELTDKKEIGNIGIISGFGLKNPEYITLAKNRNLDILISGDLTQETAILAKNLEITLIDLKHHESEIPGLYALGDVLKELNINVGIADKKPINELK